MASPAAANPTMLRLVFEQLLAGLRQLDVDVDRALERCDFEPTSEARSTNDRIPLASAVRVLEQAVVQTGRRGIGLSLGSKVRLETWDVFGYLLRSSASLGDAALRATRFVEIIAESIGLSLRIEGGRVQLTYRNTAPECGNPELSELVIGALVCSAEQLTGRPLRGAEIRFTHSPPADRTTHGAILDCPVHFLRPHDALIFDSDMLHMPIATRDARLCALLEKQAQELLNALPRSASMTRQVQDRLAAEFGGGNPSIDNVARALGVHTRTLGRRLREEGTSFQQLLDQLRHDLADRYLTESDMSITEVAFRLGYSDASAFNKAFRRWTGTAPYEYRRRVG